MKDELIFCPLGGSGEIGMNMNLFGYGKPGEHKWIIVTLVLLLQMRVFQVLI